MGLLSKLLKNIRYNKHIKIGSALKMNVSKHGISYTFGVPGFRYSRGKNAIRTSIGIPGTGLSWIKTKKYKTFKEHLEEGKIKDYILSKVSTCKECGHPVHGKNCTGIQMAGQYARMCPCDSKSAVGHLQEAKKQSKKQLLTLKHPAENIDPLGVSPSVGGSTMASLNGGTG